MDNRGDLQLHNRPSEASDARTGGAIAGALLLALPALDLLLGAASPGLVHFAVAGFGAALIALSRKLQP